jgi:hypothetical protein
LSGNNLSFQTSNAGGTPLNGQSFTLTFTAATAIPAGTVRIAYDAYYTSGSSKNAPNISTWTALAGGQSFTGNVQSDTLGTANLWQQGRTVFFALPALTANEVVTFQDVLTGGGGSSQTQQANFDNIAISGVPEPINVALACFGLGFVGVGVSRRFLPSLRKAQRA